MDFGTLPPEITSTLIYTGPGSASLTTASQAWHALSQQLSSAAQSYRGIISGLTAAWIGPSATTMTAAATTYATWLTTAGAQAEQTAVAAQSAASAYETARAATVPPTVVYANRTQLLMLIATNVIGQNAAAIAANETLYGQMWAQDAAAMYTYQTTGQVASSLPSFTSPAPTTNSATATTPSSTGLSPDSWPGQLILSMISSGPYQMPTEVLSLMTGLWVATQAASITDVMNRVTNTIDIPPIPMMSNPVTPVVPNVNAHIGNTTRIGKLTVPPSWTQQAATPPVSEPRREIVSVPGRSFPMPLPMPIGTGQRNGERRDKPPPEYGFAPKVVPGSPAGG